MNTKAMWYSLQLYVISVKLWRNLLLHDSILNDNVQIAVVVTLLNLNLNLN